MKTVLSLTLLAVAVRISAAPVPMPPASAQDVIDGVAGYKAITPAALAQAGITGSAGGWVSNQVIVATVANFYTNTTPHLIQGIANIGTTTAGSLLVNVTNSAGARFAWFSENVGTAGATTNQVSFVVPPGGWWKFAGVTTTLADGSMTLAYYTTNGRVAFASSAETASSASVALAAQATNSFESAGTLAPLVVTLATDLAANQSYFINTTNAGTDNLGYAKLTNAVNGYYIELNSASLAGAGLEPNWALFDAADGNLAYAGTPEGFWGSAANGLPYCKVTKTRTNSTSQTTILFQGYLTNAAVYVATNGNDTTGLRGIKERPFRTVAGANAVARAGDSWFFGAGNYAVEGLWTMTNANIYGDGATLVFNSPSAVIIPVGQVSFYGGCYSNQHLAGTLIGLDYTTKLLGFNSTFHGSTDCLTHKVPENFFGELSGCRFTSWWDIITASSDITATNTYLGFIGCSFETFYIPKPTIPVPNTISTAISASYFTREVISGCRIRVGDGFFRAGGIASTSSHVEVAGTTIELPSSSTNSVYVGGDQGLGGSMITDVGYPVMLGTVVLRNHANAATFSGLASTAIAATGWTNVWSTNSAVVTFGGTSVSSWKKRSGALTSTNVTYPVFTGNHTVILHPGQAIVISGTGVAGTADPLD